MKHHTRSEVAWRVRVVRIVMLRDVESQCDGPFRSRRRSTNSINVPITADAKTA
jgi:hypothetical protein